MNITLNRLVFTARSTCLFMIVLSALLYAGGSKALMPPEHYANMARHSEIKAVAVILSVETLRIGERSSEKRVTFETVFALSEMPNTMFSGICYSVDTKQQKANVTVGGKLYYYPVPGQRVFVTVRKDGGSITSLTPMTEKLERVIREEPDRIRYGIGKVAIED